MLYLAYKLPQHKNRPYLCLIKSVWIPLFPAHVAKVIFGCERFSLFLLTGRTCDLGKRGTKNHLYLRSGWTRNVWNGVKKTICIFLRIAAPSKGNDKHLVSATNWYTPDPKSNHKNFRVMKAYCCITSCRQASLEHTTETTADSQLLW